MAGIYDWILNSLKVDQSPATNQLPTPLPAQNITGLPVPFQSMPSESASFNPFTKLKNMFTSTNPNPTISQDTGTYPSSPNDPLKTSYMDKMIARMMGNGDETQIDSKTPSIPYNVGNPSQQNFDQIPSFNMANSGGNTRSAMLMKMLQEMPMNNGDFS